jgi:hypothetical protein
MGILVFIPVFALFILFLIYLNEDSIAYCDGSTFWECSLHPGVCLFRGRKSMAHSSTSLIV